MKLYRFYYNNHGIVYIFANSLDEASKKFDKYYQKKDKDGEPNNLKIELMIGDIVNE